MTPEFVDKIFEPFTRANDTRTTRTEGTGLGMPIVKSIVDLMGGDINIESELGKGTTFIIDLPMKTLDTAVEDLEKIKGLDVLVVDNEQTACEAACLLVEEIGMNSEYVLSGEEAVEKVREKHGTRGEKQYDAIILDWNMPGMSGVEAAEKIRAITGERLPIIILSAYDWSTIEQEAREKGVNAFLSKPLFRSRLVHVMIELVTNEKIDQDDMYDVIKQKDYSGHKVLLVEDNPISQGIAKDILETMKLNVDVADDGQQACLTLENSEPHTYDLVFMDIQMPIMNGYEATKNIREIGKTDRPDLSEIPIIALTADAFLEDINNANNAGMNDHISKPIEFDRLIETLNKYLD